MGELRSEAMSAASTSLRFHTTRMQKRRQRAEIVIGLAVIGRLWIWVARFDLFYLFLEALCIVWLEKL